MRRIVLPLVFIVLSSVVMWAQEATPTPPASVPVATRSQAACTGFIADPAVPRDMFVLGGADDDFHSVARQFVQGESIFISHHGEQNPAVGSRYRIVRPANALFETMHYAGERSEIGKAGKPYEDIAEVTVTHVNPEGVVALVNLSCEPIMSGDTVMAFEPRPIPEYALTGPLDHFAPPDSSKKHGRIIASRNNYGSFGKQYVVYLNLGQGDGATPGQRFRIFKALPPHSTGFLTSEKTPEEVVGELVVLSVETKSCVAMVVSSYREIAAGDYVEAE